MLNPAGKHNVLKLNHMVTCYGMCEVENTRQQLAMFLNAQKASYGGPKFIIFRSVKRRFVFRLNITLQFNGMSRRNDFQWTGLFDFFFQKFKYENPSVKFDRRPYTVGAST